MPHHAPRLLAAPLAALVLLAACGDDDGTGPGAQTPASVEIANEPLSFDLAGQSAQLDVTVLDEDGEPIADPDLTFTTSADDVAAVSQSGVVTALGNGVADITVAAGTVSASIDVSVDITPTALEAGVPAGDLTAPEGGQLFFTLDVPAGNEGGQVLQVRLLGGTGDADLAVRHATRPDLDTFDCVSAGAPNDLDNVELCMLVDPAPGTWHVLVYAWEAFTGVEVQADLKEWMELTPGVAETGLEVDFMDALYYRVDLEDGQTLDLSTSGGTGDADLLGTQMDSFSILDFLDLECASGSTGNEESCSVTATSAGTWTVFVFGYEAFTGVALTPNVEAAASSTRRAAAPGTSAGWATVRHRGWAALPDGTR